MNQIITNFFELEITPQIETLYVTELKKGIAFNSPNNVVTYLHREAVVSFLPLDNSRKILPKPHYVEWLMKRLIFDLFDKSEDFFDTDYRWGETTLIKERIIHRDEYSILRKILVRVLHTNGKFILAIDPITRLYSRLSAAKLVNSYGFTWNDLVKIRKSLIFVEKNGKRQWVHGTIRDFISPDIVKVEARNIFDGTIEVSASRVVPRLDKDELSNIVMRKNPRIDINKEVKQNSFFTSKQKYLLIQNIFENYISKLFPFNLNEIVFNINSKPLDSTLFNNYKIDPADEPDYVITRPNLAQVRNKKCLPALSNVNILNSNQLKEHKVVLFATKDSLNYLKSIVAQLNKGVSSGSFTFSLPMQFGIKLNITDEFVGSNYDNYDWDIDKFIYSDEEKHKDAIALISLPLNSPYYFKYKAKLAYFGRISQVISRTNFDIYFAWNLATNIFAKLGYYPWGISDSPTLQNADIVLGFAFSALRNEGKIRRNIGYVNVFDRNGVWRFTQSQSSYFDFDNRLRLLPDLMRSAVQGYLAATDKLKVIDIHYTKKFSYDERRAIFNAIKDIVPDIQEINFISLDKTHPYRVFDTRNGNFNFLRGGILQLREKDFLLSIAGNNSPNAECSRLLRVQVWREPFDDRNVDIIPIAYRILAMSKLNWRSAVKETTEPVTLKYAEEIARMTNHFSLTEWKTVNTLLSKVPWFI